MRYSDRAAWSSAACLRDLGHLTADWLEGRIGSQPGYEPDCGPDSETTELVPVLAQANRVGGFVTVMSQPGFAPEVGADGETWAQRAAVQGWISPSAAGELAAIAEVAGLLVAARPGAHPRCFRRDRRSIAVTCRNGRSVTRIGVRPNRRDVAVQWAEAGRAARRDLRSATYLALAAPGWAPDQTLWNVLRKYSNERGG